MDGDLGVRDMELGLVKLLAAAGSVSCWEYAALLCIITGILLYHMLEFHFVGDFLGGWRGDVVHIVHSPRSSVTAHLLSKCEILQKRYWPTPWLASPHLQTLFLHFFGRSPRIAYQRQLYITTDGGTIALDWVHPRASTESESGEDGGQGPTSDETPTVIIVPGLTSDSTNHYIKHLVGSLSDSGWRVLVINHRGLGGISITSDQFYNAGWTEDLRTLLLYVQEKYPKSPLLAVGTSIGANILVKYLGEEGTKTPVGAAVAICCPWDLMLCDRFISRNWVQAIYNKVLASGLCDYARLHENAFTRMMNWDLLSTSRSVRDFDDNCTRLVGKYETVDKYYRRCGSAQFLEGVAVPLLCVSAEDDPICTKEAIPYDECRINPNIILAVTKHGGHLGYFEGLPAKTIWYVRAATEFSRVILSSSFMHRQNEVDTSTDPKNASAIDQGPFLALGENSTVAPKTTGHDGEDPTALHERPAETSELRSGALKVVGSTIHEGPQLSRDKSDRLASSYCEKDENYIIVSDDFGGPIYKTVEGSCETTHTSSVDREAKINGGQTTVKLQFRSFSELLAVQSVLSQLLEQLRLQSSVAEGSGQGAASSKLELPKQRTTSASSPPVSPSVSPGRGGSTKELLSKDKSAAKAILHKYNKKILSRGKEGNSSLESNPIKKDLASLASQNRRNLWILTYIALITSFPFLGSALLVRTRGKVLQAVSRQWLKYKAA